MDVKRKTGQSVFTPVIIFFVLVSSITVVFKKTLTTHEVDLQLLIYGNIILFAVTASSFLFYRRALVAGNTQAFLRNVYSGMMIKFFVCIAATFIYVYSSGNQVNKPALFTLMFLYLVYTFIETALLMKQSRQIKQNRNA